MFRPGADLFGKSWILRYRNDLALNPMRKLSYEQFYATLGFNLTMNALIIKIRDKNRRRQIKTVKKTLTIILRKPIP